jgi:hypothetical protein
VHAGVEMDLERRIGMNVQQSEPENPVVLIDGKWYFWDESWTDQHGPFDSKFHAEIELQCYMHWLDTEEIYHVHHQDKKGVIK